MKERHLPEPCRSRNDGLLEVLRPLGRALGRQVTVQAHVGSLHVGALAQAGRCPGHGVRALSLPFGQEAPMRDVRREALVARCSQEKAGTQRLFTFASRAAPRRRTAYAHRPAARNLCCDEQADELPSDNVSRATYRAEAPEFKISATMSAPPQLPCQLEPPPPPHSNPWLPLLIDRLHRLPPTAL